MAWGRRRWDVRPHVSKGSETIPLSFGVCPWVGDLISFLLNIPFAFLIPPHPLAWDSHVSENREEVIQPKVEGWEAGL